MAKRVAILGGGIAGMTAAHELIERDFQVTVYEMRDTPGGKARSMRVHGSGTGDRHDLLGEHGFRFFPGFYKHLPDTMKRIPAGQPGKQWVFDNLVLPESTLLARGNGQGDVVFAAQPPTTLSDVFTQVNTLFTHDLGFKPGEIGLYIERLLVLLTSCTERRFREYERLDWSEFVGANDLTRSEAYRKYCADGLTRSLVACRANLMSARTGGYILLQLLFDLVRPGIQANRVLSGPTSTVWLEPWRDHLKDRGVDFRTGAKVTKLLYADRRITGAVIEEKETQYCAVADYYISALPVELLDPAAVDDGPNPTEGLITPEMKRDDRRLRYLHKLQVEWMNGIQFFLKPDAPVVRGHVLYVDSKWSLTSISQKQFWSSVNLADYGDGTVEGVLSVDISDWNTPGGNGKPAKQCEAVEIKDEVWDQIRSHLNDDNKHELDNNVQIVRWFLDEDIRFPNPNQLSNAEPLLVNIKRSWIFRPKAVTRIKNFFLAGDYVRTNTDLATMESANEAARRAVNGILKASGSAAQRCKIWSLREPWIFGPLRRWDRRRFRRLPRLPHHRSLIRFALLLFLPLWRMFHLWWRGFWAVMHYLDLADGFLRLLSKFRF